MIIQHNMASAFTQLQLKTTTGVKRKSSEKLSSGYRINRAADDAAGLAISEKMRRQIRGLTQNLENIQDGVCFCQIADGYLNEVHDMMQRVNELAVKGAKQTYDIAYDGTLGTANMKDSAERVTIGLTQDGDTTFKRTNVTYAYANETQLSDEEVADLLDAGTTFETQFKMNSSVESDWNTVDGTVKVKNGILTHRQNFVDENETNDNNYAFSIYHEMTYDQIVGSSGGGSADLSLSFDAKATRSFTPVPSNKTIDEHDFNNIEIIAPKKSLVIQASPDSPIEEQIEILWSCMTLNSVYMSGTNTRSASSCRAAIDQVKKGIQVISEQRGIFGASQNRLEHAYKEVGNTRENTQASESLIRDTDMAKEYSQLAAHNILEQAGQAMLAQANQSTNGVLSLLQ